MSKYNDMTKKELLVLIGEKDAAQADLMSKAKKEVLVAWLEANTVRSMSKTLMEYRPGYTLTLSYAGRKSLHNADPVAMFLAGEDPEVVLTKAEKILGLDAGFLTEKYAGLNPGQKRMNGGNRIRAALKRGDIVAADLH